MYYAIAGRGEQTFSVKIFGNGEYLRDASMMHHDRLCVSARRDGCCRCDWTRIRREGRQKIEPIAHRARHNGSQSRSQTEQIDESQRREKCLEALWIRENRAHGATL